MTLLLSTLNQMAFLFVLLLIGYLVARLRVVPDNTATVLSKLENLIFVPALTLSTFMTGFRIERIGTALQFFLGGFVVVGLSIPLALFLARRCSKDDYIRRIYTYGLSFSNFGFMGNAVFSALFPDLFWAYLIFVLPLWTLIYLWGVPVLLIPAEGDSPSLRQRLKSFVNPMFIAMVIGMIIGLLNLELPSFATSAITTLGSCMSPLAMLLTGMTIARIDLKATFQNASLYAVSFLRLIVLPAIFLILLVFLPIERDLAICVLCALAMPLGLNTIVIPSAYGKDTSVAAGMALLSHLLSCATIPLVFMVFDFIMK